MMQLDSKLKDIVFGLLKDFWIYDGDTSSEALYRQDESPWWMQPLLYGHQNASKHLACFLLSGVMTSCPVGHTGRTIIF